MIINYDVKELFFLLLKRWYIIVAVALLSAAVVTPLSTASYNTAVENYKQKTDYDVILAQERQKAQTTYERAEEHQLNETTDEVILVHAAVYYNFEMILDGELPEEGSEGLKQDSSAYMDAMRNVVAFSSNDAFAIPLFESFGEELPLEYNQFKGTYSVSIVPGMDMIELSIKNIPETALDLLVQRFADQMVNYLDVAIGVKARMTPSNTIKNREPRIREVAPQNAEIALKNVATQKLRFNKEILREPTMKSSRVKYMCSAGLFGAIAACFGILAIDFLIRSANQGKSNLHQEE